MIEQVKEFWNKEFNDYVKETHIAHQQSFEKLLPELRQSLYVVELDFGKNPTYAKFSTFIADSLISDNKARKRLTNKVGKYIRLIDLTSVGILYKLVGTDPQEEVP